MFLFVAQASPGNNMHINLPLSLCRHLVLLLSLSPLCAPSHPKSPNDTRTISSIGAMFAPGCAEGLFINASPFATGSHPPLRRLKAPHFSTVKLITLRGRGRKKRRRFLSVRGEVAGVNPRSMCALKPRGAVKRLSVRVKAVLGANGMEN